MLRITIASLLLFFSHLVHSSDTLQLDLPYDILGNIILYLGDDSHSLQSLSCTNKNLYSFMHPRYAARCNELKNYIADPANGINSKLVTFAPNNLRAYFIETDEESKNNAPASFLITVSHYGDDCKKEIMCEWYDESLYKHKLAKRIKPFIIQNAQKLNTIYMFGRYRATKDTSSELVQINHKESGQPVCLYFQLNDLLIPSGWLADILPKLHDAVINTGIAHYTPWNGCDEKSPLAKIHKKHMRKFSLPAGKPFTIDTCNGVVIFDLKDFTGITDNDRITLFKEYQGARSDELTALVKFPIGATEAMHMHFSWGNEKVVIKDLACLIPINYYVVPKYGLFKFNAFNELIVFEPPQKGLKKVRRRALTVADTTCSHALEYLKKKNAFVTKDWSAHADALFQTLKDFAATRYTCKHNNKWLLVKDTVRSALYAIRLTDNKHPIIDFRPAVNLSKCKLIDDGYEWDPQPDNADPNM
jgi:hypothetical protein